jgi:hypothetical protein
MSPNQVISIKKCPEGLELTLSSKVRNLGDLEITPSFEIVPVGKNITNTWLLKSLESGKINLIIKQTD